jgi:hypothetical protein
MNVILDKEFHGYNPEYVTFETGASLDIISDLNNNSFDNWYQSAIVSFYDVLLLGKPMPNIMLMNHINHYANILAATFHIYPLDIFSEHAAQLVFVIDHIDRYGGLGFLTANHKIDCLLKSVFNHINIKDSDNEEICGMALKAGIDIFHDFLVSGIQVFENNILYSKDTFVVARVENLEDIDNLYKSGYLWGVIYIKDRVRMFNRSGLTGAPADKLLELLGGCSSDRYLNTKVDLQEIIRIHSLLMSE